MNNDTVLCVSGIPVDTIVTLGEYTDIFATLMRDVRAWRDLALGTARGRAYDAYVGGGNMQDAFNRTIVGDKTRSGHRAQRGQRSIEAFMMDEDSLPESYRHWQGLSPGERLRFWIEDVIQAIAFRSQRRRLFITKKGYLGLGPRDAELGDSVFILLGCKVPVVLRNKGEQWDFVGEAFVTGIMDGEIVYRAQQELSQSLQTSEQTSVLAQNLGEEILLC